MRAGLYDVTFKTSGVYNEVTVTNTWQPLKWGEDNNWVPSQATDRPAWLQHILTAYCDQPCTYFVAYDPQRPYQVAVYVLDQDTKKALKHRSVKQKNILAYARYRYSALFAVQALMHLVNYCCGDEASLFSLGFCLYQIAHIYFNEPTVHNTYELCPTNIVFQDLCPERDATTALATGTLIATGLSVWATNKMELPAASIVGTLATGCELLKRANP